MPQLNPTPWFPIFLLTWLMLLVLLTPKLSHLHHPTPTTTNTQAPTPNKWPWPWY